MSWKLACSVNLSRRGCGVNLSSAQPHPERSKTRQRFSRLRHEQNLAKYQPPPRAPLALWLDKLAQSTDYFCLRSENGGLNINFLKIRSATNETPKTTPNQITPLLTPAGKRAAVPQYGSIRLMLLSFWCKFCSLMSVAVKNCFPAPFMMSSTECRPTWGNTSFPQ